MYSVCVVVAGYLAVYNVYYCTPLVDSNYFEERVKTPLQRSAFLMYIPVYSIYFLPSRVQLVD